MDTMLLSERRSVNYSSEAPLVTNAQMQPITTRANHASSMHPPMSHQSESLGAKKFSPNAKPLMPKALEPNRGYPSALR